MTDKYCPRGEIKKLEVELWNLKVKDTDVIGYNQRFQELALMCVRMFPEESDKIERYVGGLPDMIHRSVMASKPKTMQYAIEMATELMDKKIITLVERQAENKRKLDNNNQAQQQSPKRQDVAQAYAAGTGERKEYAGTLPLCNKCKFHHNGPCTAKKERIKPLRVRALVMTIVLDLPKQILNAQTEAQKTENLKREDVRVVRFGKRGKLNPIYVGPFKVLEKVRSIAYKLEFPQELSMVHNTFHVSNLKKCYSDDPLVVQLEGLHVDDKLHFVKELVEIIDREVKRLKQSCIKIVKVAFDHYRDAFSVIYLLSYTQGVTYQRPVDKVFNKQIGRNLEAYVDDMVIKSNFEEGMLSDIQETFERFRSINMKLNPKKCSFGVEEGPFLGHLITKQGIKANLTKIKAVTELEQPRALKDMKSLNGKLAAFSRFLSKGAEIPLPFFKVLQGAELNYPALEKLILALVHAVRRLRRYFQAHTIMVPTCIPIKQALTGPEKTRRVAKSAIKLGKHDIIFLKRDERETPADFLPEIPFNDSEKKVKEKEVSDPSNKWKLYTNGASSPDVEHIRKNQNKNADALSKLAWMTFEHLTKEVLVEVLAKRSIEEKEVLKVEIKEKRSWMSPIQEYLLSGLLPEDTKEARKIRIQVPQYKLIRAVKAIQDCNKCKEQSAMWKARADGAITVRSTWPFSHWGIHILGPLQMALGGLQFLTITVEHSIKWVEAKPITVKNARQVEKFVWKYVVCRFGVPWMISSKEEKHFKEGIFVYRTLPRNSQEETPFSLTYGSEAVVPIVEATDDRGRTQETTKKGKEIASIEKAHYRNKLRKYHNTRNNYSNYIVGDFVLFPTSSQEQQGPHMISEVHKDGFYTLVNIADHSLIQKAKGTSLRKFYM
ncbi:reverse transcriptase domain-containing protein [Tanacetum coccineum]